MDTRPMDIIDRLSDDELYVDAVDDAIAEIQKLRATLALLRRCKNNGLVAYEWDDPAEFEAWREL